jgi:hypothetical protein
VCFNVAHEFPWAASEGFEKYLNVKGFKFRFSFFVFFISFFFQRVSDRRGWESLVGGGGQLIKMDRGLVCMCVVVYFLHQGVAKDSGDATG